MRHTFKIYVFGALFLAAMSSCSKDNFSAGWDNQIVSSTVTLDQAIEQDISLGTINLEDQAIVYANLNHPNSDDIRIIEVLPTFGSISSVDLLPLSFVEALDIYALQGDRELLIGQLASESTQNASIGLDGVDVNLYDFGGDDDIELILRPSYNEIGTQMPVMDIDIRFSLSYSITGKK